MFLLSAALLLGMQTSPVPVRIEVKASSEGCVTLVDGVRTGEQSLETSAIEWARSGASVELSGDDNVPYRCIGELIFALQGAGFGSHPQVEPGAPLRVTFSAPVRLEISGSCLISINGRPATFAEYARLAALWGRNQPEVHLLPDPSTEYECVDRVFAVIRDNGITKLGFIGNEAVDSGDDE